MKQENITVLEIYWPHTYGNQTYVLVCVIAAQTAKAMVCAPPVTQSVVNFEVAHLMASVESPQFSPPSPASSDGERKRPQ
jgi:hypothetical protein